MEWDGPRLSLKVSAEDEAAIRRDERRLLAKAVLTAVDDTDEYVALMRALRDQPELRGRAGLLVHTLVQLVTAFDEEVGRGQ